MKLQEAFAKKTYRNRYRNRSNIVNLLLTELEEQFRAEFERGDSGSSPSIEAYFAELPLEEVENDLWTYLSDIIVPAVSEAWETKWDTN